MEVVEGLECNCSHCGAKGFILSFIPEAQFRLLTGQDNLTEYLFNKKHISHLFCKTCGVQSFGRGSDPEGNNTVAVNLRCVQGIDLENLPKQKFNGRDI
jgi:hypothetical protein